MREIKYRAKTATTNEWVYGHYAFVDGFHVIYENGRPLIIQLNTLGQYTGLEDKNGKEIFEGDLIRKQFKDREIGEFYAVGQVVFGKWYAGFTVPYKYNVYNKLERLSSEMNKDGWVVANQDMEVIGNIYENPELLEKSK